MLWALFTVIAAIAQTARNAMQRDLTARLGTVGATHVRFLFGLPFALIFLGAVVAIGGAPPPLPPPDVLLDTAIGALAQIVATAMMLAAMRSKSFVVTTAYTKTEPILVAVFGLVVLGDRLTEIAALAILIATGGVVLTAWPKRDEARFAPWPVLLGVGAAALFAVSAVEYRAAITGLADGGFVLRASTILASALFMQAVALSLYLLATDRAVLLAIVQHWRPALFAGFMGAFASQFWFLGFALATAAQVRTLALIEVLFARAVSGRLFRESPSGREVVGLALIVLGVGLILNV